MFFVLFVYLYIKDILSCVMIFCVVFVEKLLRVHKVKRMYLLIRATDTKAAMQRLRGDYAFHDQILDKEVFSVLKEKHGSGFQSFVRSKLQPVGGDIGHENLGIRDPDQRQNLFEEVQIIVHVAAIEI